MRDQLDNAAWMTNLIKKSCIANPPPPHLSYHDSHHWIPNHGKCEGGISSIRLKSATNSIPIRTPPIFTPVSQSPTPIWLLLLMFARSLLWFYPVNLFKVDSTHFTTSFIDFTCAFGSYYQLNHGFQPVFKEGLFQSQGMVEGHLYFPKYSVIFDLHAGHIKQHDGPRIRQSWVKPSLLKSSCPVALMFLFFCFISLVITRRSIMQ